MILDGFITHRTAYPPSCTARSGLLSGPFGQIQRLQEFCRFLRQSQDGGGFFPRQILRVLFDSQLKPHGKTLPCRLDIIKIHKRLTGPREILAHDTGVDRQDPTLIVQGGGLSLNSRGGLVLHLRIDRSALVLKIINLCLGLIRQFLVSFFGFLETCFGFLALFRGGLAARLGLNCRILNCPIKRFG